MSDRILNYFFFQICPAAPGLELSGLTESHVCLIQTREHHDFPQSQVQSPASGSGKSPAAVQTGGGNN